VSGEVGIDFNTAPPSLINTLQVNPPRLVVDRIPSFSVTVQIDPLVDVTPPRITGNGPRVTFANGGYNIDFGNLTVIPGSVRLTPAGKKLLADAQKKGKMALLEAQRRTSQALAAARQVLDRAKADAEQAIARLRNDVRDRANALRDQWNSMLQDVQRRIQAARDRLADILRNLPPPPPPPPFGF
jgi:hypothetical protein